ncbi:MAG TPA: YccF domain-containing protein [Anaerolineales bacterium]|nr:YccF domain-containing protein [Anaerolineales bacterium]
MTQESYKKNPGCLIQLLWYFLIGVWVGQIWVWVAYLLILLVVTMPLGFAMLNLLPKVVALREPERILSHEPSGDVSITDKPQVNFFLRAIYFLLIGWWLGLLWIEVAYLFNASIIGIPIGFWMFDKTPAIINLRRQ